MGRGRQGCKPGRGARSEMVFLQFPETRHPSPPAAPSPKMALKTVRFRDSWCSVVSLCVDLNSDYDRGTTGSTESPKKQGELLGESLSS